MVHYSIIGYIIIVPFSLFHWCVAVCLISSEFMLGFVQSIDGEKDPRNLLIVFDTVPLITTHLNLGEYHSVE